MFVVVLFITDSFFNLLWAILEEKQKTGKSVRLKMAYPLQDIDFLGVGADELSSGLDPFLARSADGHGDERVLLQIGGGAELVPERLEALVSEAALEDARSIWRRA